MRAQSRWVIAHLRATAARRTAGVVLVALLLSGAVIFYRAAPEFLAAPPAATGPRPSLPHVSPSATSTGSAAGTSSTSSSVQPSSALPSPAQLAPTEPVGTPTTSQSSTTTAAAGTALRPGVPNRPHTGPGITEPGIQLTASPASDGSFDVSELVLLSHPQAALSLRPPPISTAGNDFRSSSPVATAVQVTAGDQPVVLPSDTVSAAVTLPLGSGQQRFELRYRLTGVTIRSIPSKAGRALAAIGPLIGQVADDLPVAVTVVGSGVRNLECPTLSLGERACAAGVVPELRVNRVLPWTASVVVVQLDLSSPR